jgi:hypothetical protein
MTVPSERRARLLCDPAEIAVTVTPAAKGGEKTTATGLVLQA